MTLVNGLPAHILLVHFVIVLAPLLALLTVLAAVFPAVRRRLVWFIAPTAVITAIVTFLTSEAGEWLETRLPAAPAIEEHAELGDLMLYFTIGLVVVAGALVIMQVRETRGSSTPRWQSLAVVVLAIVVGVSTAVHVYRVGESGAEATWSGEVQAGSELSVSPE